MIKVIQKRKRKLIVQDVVESNPSDGTLGNLVLLKETYRNQKNSNFDQMLFNYEFLLEMQKKFGRLWCVYCGRERLRIYHWREYAGGRRNMATVDHFFPKSKAPHLARDVDNLRVACHKCNNKKGDKYWDEKYPYFEK